MMWISAVNLAMALVNTMFFVFCGRHPLNAVAAVFGLFATIVTGIVAW